MNWQITNIKYIKGWKGTILELINHKQMLWCHIIYTKHDKDMVDFVRWYKQTSIYVVVFFSHVHVSIVMEKFRFRTLIRLKRMEASRICFVLRLCLEIFWQKSKEMGDWEIEITWRGNITDAIKWQYIACVNVEVNVAYLALHICCD